MPNWVKNIVHAMKDDVDFSEFEGDEGFTFEKILPMPADISRESLTITDRLQSKGRNWYDWSIANWGTKWDASSPYVNGPSVEFDTAWSCPEPLLRALAKKVGPLLVFYADEGISENSGGLFIKKDGTIEEISKDQIAYFVIYSGGNVYDRDSAIDGFGWLFEEEDDE